MFQCSRITLVVQLMKNIVGCLLNCFASSKYNLNECSHSRGVYRGVAVSVLDCQSIEGSKYEGLRFMFHLRPSQTNYKGHTLTVRR